MIVEKVAYCGTEREHICVLPSVGYSEFSL